MSRLWKFLMWVVEVLPEAAHTTRYIVVRLLFAAVLITSLRFERTPPSDRENGLNRILAGKQFDFASWLGTATLNKLGHELLLPQHRLSTAEQVQFVRDYMVQVRNFQQLESQIRQVFIDPAVRDPQAATSTLRQNRDSVRRAINAHQDLAEAILQEQVESVLREEGFALGGQVLPPVRFRYTELPDVLIVSRRDKIERIDQRVLTTGLTVDQFDHIERTVDKQFDVSSIVEPIGGLGSYPTMLGETESIEWSVGTIAHEWTHNYLLLSYVGRHYDDIPAARTINETAASIVQHEVQQRVLQRYYPELAASWSSVFSNLPSLLVHQPLLASLSLDRATAAFDFNKEMRTTRLTADALLAAGQIEEAEAYMEQRRKLFVQNGYGLRKLNQAYFAFHGAYNATPGGAPAAGRDKIGPAVQALRKRSATLGDFLRAIAALTDAREIAP